MSGRLFAILLVSVGIVIAFAGFPFIPKPVNLNYTERVGLIEATEVHLSAKISERIKEIPFNEGDFVPQGAAVVQLHVDELEVEAARAEADILRAEADILTAKAVFEKEQASLSDAKRNLGRVSKLFRDGLISTAKLDAAKTQLDLAAADLNVAAARIRSAKAELKQRHAHLRLFQVRMKEGTIYAPIAGRVTLKAYEAGEMVSPGRTILSLIDPDSLWARIDLEEGEIGKIHLGGRAEILIGFDPGDVITGKIIEIGTTGSFATQRDTTRGRQDIKTFRVKVGLVSSKGFLKPGMTVKVRFYFERNQRETPSAGLQG